MIASPDPWIAMLAGIIICFVVAASIATVRYRLLISLRRWSPEVRAAAFFLLLIAPFGFGVSTAAMTSLSADGVVLDLVVHHCHADVAGCDAHRPVESTPLVNALGATLLAGGLLWLVITAASQLRMTLRTTNLLNLAVRKGGRAEIGILNTDDTVACVIGVLRPRIFLSRGLWRGLNISERKIVLRHERSHLSRRDYPVRQLATLLAIGHGRETFKQLLDELMLAQEQVCDRAAAHFYGTLRTAETLIKVQRLRRARATFNEGCAGFLDGSVTARIHALLEPSFFPTTRCAAGLCGAIGVAAIALVAVTEPLHHLAETIVQSFAI